MKLNPEPIILMADDDPDDRMLLKEALEENNLAHSLHFAVAALPPPLNGEIAQLAWVPLSSIERRVFVSAPEEPEAFSQLFSSSVCQLDVLGFVLNNSMRVSGAFSAVSSHSSHRSNW